MTKLELRQVDVELSGAKEESGDLLVSGYVNQTGQWSQPLGREKRFIERIEPGTFQRALDKGNDIHFLAEHDNKLLLASTKNGSLSLREDDKGLHMTARISPTSWGKDYHQLISDGLLTNMSFGMGVSADKWEKRSDGTYERSISDLTLAEVSVVRNPAYVQSSIQARSIELIDEPTINITEEPKMSKEKTLKELRAQMEALEAEVRAENENVKVVENRNEPVVDQNEVEVRGVEQFIRGNVNAAEVRNLITTSTPGSLTVPTSLSNTIIEKLFEVAPLLSRTRSFTPVSGYLEILREQSIGTASFVSEWSNATANDFTMDKVKLEQRRIASAVELSEQLINDSGIDIVGYASNILTRRLALLTERTIINGTKADKFEGLQGSVNISEVTAASATAIAIDELLQLTLSMHPDYLKDAVFVVNRNTFNLIAKLKDSQGQYYLVRDVASGGPVYSLFGHPVLINDAVDSVATGTRSVLFGNFGAGYATMIKKGIQMKRIADDTTQALRGSQLLMIDVYMDGKVLNENAFKWLRHTGTPVIYPA